MGPFAISSKFKSAIYYSLLVFIILRVFSSLVLLIGIVQPPSMVPIHENTAKNLSTYENNSSISKYFLAPWYRWDTVQYLEIAEYGYDFNTINTVWPPLYPFLTKFFALIIKSSLLSSLIVSNVFTIISFILLYLYTDELFSEETAKKTLFFLAIFPTSFYLIAGYTESLFLACSLAGFIFLRKKQWLLAGLMSALATLVRNQGILLVIPIFFELYLHYFKTQQYRPFFTHSFSLIYAPFSYLLFSLYVKFGLNENWPWVTLSKVWGQHFGLPWEGLLGNLSVLFGRPIYLDMSSPFIKILSLILTFLSIYFLLRIQHKIPISLSVYSWASLLLILAKVDNQSIMVSTIRYLLVLFPVFISHALYIKNHRIIQVIYLFSTSAAIILLVLFYWWIWVA